MKEKKKSFSVFIGITILLLFVILLENISSFIPGLPQVFQPTSPLFTVLKKAAVYSLVAVSMNLLNGFTGLFSLGQAVFMAIGAYTFSILAIPVASRQSVYYATGINPIIEQASLPIPLAMIAGGLMAALFAKAQVPVLEVGERLPYLYYWDTNWVDYKTFTHFNGESVYRYGMYTGYGMDVL